MKRFLPIALTLVVVGGFAWTVKFLYAKSKKPPVVYETRTPEITDITVKTVATGALVPRQEIEIKPRVSGVIAELYVEPGQKVEPGQNVARIRIIPDVVRLNQAESQVAAALLAYQNAERELSRNRELFDKQVLSETELARRTFEFEQRKQELAAARSNLQLIKEGASRRSGVASNVVTSTVAGTVLEVPVEVGVSVIESNTFNAGTTVATVADMSDMIFKGTVDESEVGKIREGMRLDIKIGALEDVRLRGTLEYISPKGVAEEGVIKFEIRAAIDTPSASPATASAQASSPDPPAGERSAAGKRKPAAEPAAAEPAKPSEPAADEPANRSRTSEVVLRANYSANADIVLARREKVLAIAESLLQFDGDEPFVELEIEPQQFERRDVEVGLSDGINIEILSGIERDARIKKYQGARGDGRGGPPNARGRGRRGGGGGN